MLCAIAVAVSFAEPVLLEMIPITPEVLVGQWRKVAIARPVLLGDLGTFVVRPDGTFTSQPRYVATGEVGPAQSGTYKINGRVLTIDILTPGYKAHAENIVVLLPGGRLRLTDRDNGVTSSTFVKISDKP